VVEAFKHFVETLHPSFERLIQMNPLKMSALPSNLPEKCIYLLSEGENHLYVGRTRRLRQRLRQHSVAGAQHNHAVFAFKLAREVTGRLAAAYSPAGSRLALCAEPAFAEGVRKPEFKEKTATTSSLKEPVRTCGFCSIALSASVRTF